MKSRSTLAAAAPRSRPSPASTLNVRAAAALVIASIPTPRLRHAAIASGGGNACALPVPSSTTSGASAKSGSRFSGVNLRASLTAQSSTNTCAETIKTARQYLLINQHAAAIGSAQIIEVIGLFKDKLHRIIPRRPPITVQTPPEPATGAPASRPRTNQVAAGFAGGCRQPGRSAARPQRVVPAAPGPAPHWRAPGRLPARTPAVLAEWPKVSRNGLILDCETGEHTARMRRFGAKTAAPERFLPFCHRRDNPAVFPSGRLPAHRRGYAAAIKT